MDRAVLFDFDGTLFFGTFALNEWCFRRALSEMGLPEPTKEKIDRTVGMTTRELAVEMTDSTDDSIIDEFLRRVFDYVPKYIASEVEPIPGERELLLALKKETRIAICSNAAPDYILPLLDKLGIADVFDHIRYYREGYRKVTAIPEILRELGVTEAIFAGDRLEDVESAHGAGIRIAGIRNAAFPRETDGADTVAESLEELISNIRAMLAGER